MSGHVTFHHNAENVRTTKRERVCQAPPNIVLNGQAQMDVLAGLLIVLGTCLVLIESLCIFLVAFVRVMLNAGVMLNACKGWLSIQVQQN